VDARRCAVRAVALAALGGAFTTAPLVAQGAWSASGAADGPGTAQTASQVTPGVTVTGCSWNSTTRVLLASVSWTKSAFATSTVVRNPLAGSSTTVASALATTVTTFSSPVPITIGTSGGASSTTSAYTWSVTAVAGLYWSRTGTSAPYTFTATNKKGSGLDTCVVV
jgi:hypothetical protein